MLAKGDHSVDKLILDDLILDEILLADDYRVVQEVGGRLLSSRPKVAQPNLEKLMKVILPDSA